jgi:Zn-finger nucleic acid-binding protein
MAKPDGLILPARRCNACGGTWLELGEIKSQLPNPSLLWNALSKGGTPTGLACPACRDRPLSKANYKHNEIDWCPTCKGVLFDAGELASIQSAMRKKRHLPVGEVVASVGGEVGGWVVGELIVEAVGWVLEASADVT